jgi:DNA-binding response OmpR family regulator
MESHREALAAAGMEIIQAPPTVEVPQEIYVKIPDVVVIDLTDRAAQGIAFGERLRSTDKTEAVPILFYAVPPGRWEQARSVAGSILLGAPSPDRLLREVEAAVTRIHAEGYSQEGGIGNVIA